MEFETCLLMTRAVLHFGTFLVIASYVPNGARYRWGVSVAAMSLAMGSAGLGMWIVTGVLTGAFTVQYTGPQWLYLLVFGPVFLLVLRCRGNLARILPRFRRRGAI